MSKNRPAMSVAAIVLAAIVLAGLVVAGCGDDEATQSASVEITSVSPAQTYPGISATIDFEITPGPDTSANDLSWEVRFDDGQSTTGEALSARASHAWQTSRQYRVDVVALAGDKEVGHDYATVEVLPPVDLALREATGSPANVETGQDVVVSVTASNAEAGRIETPFVLTIYLSESPTLADQDFSELAVLGTKRVEADQDGQAIIEAGRERVLGATLAIPEDIATGDYHLVARVDPTGQLADNNPANNVAVAQGLTRVENTAATVADLAVKNPILIPSRAFPSLNKITRGYTIANIGNVDAFDVSAKVWLSVGDQTIDPGEDTLVDTRESLHVAAGDEVVVDPQEIILDQDIAPPDGQSEIEVYMVVEVAIDGDATEANLDNNRQATASPTVVSNQRVDGADLAVRAFDITPESTFLDGTLSTSLTIANEGSVDATSFFCGIYLGDDAVVDTDSDPRLTNINFSSLASQTEQHVERSFVVPGLYDPGTYYLYVVCDPQGALSEPYRSNNRQLNPEPITITDQADVDVRVDALSAPADARDGDNVELTATICVSGSNSSGPLQAKLWRSAGQAPDFSAESIASFDVPNINPGDCADVAVDTQARCADFEDQYGYGIAVDVDDELPETNEDNNRGQTDDLLEVSGQACRCSDDGLANDNATDAFALDDTVLDGSSYADSICAPEACDYYTVNLGVDDSLVVSTDYQTDRGRLTTKLFDPSGLSQLDKSVADGHQEVAQFLAPSAGDYLLSVCGSDPSVQNLYDLDVQVLSPSAGTDLLARQLTVPQRDTFSIGAELDVSFRVYNIGQAASAADIDANLVMSANATIGDADDIALEPATTPVGAVPAGTLDEVSTTVTIPTSIADGDYYVGVNLASTDDDPSNNTAISRLITVETACFDPLEPNDGFQSAYPLTAGSYSNLSACTAADDYYEICAEDGKTLTVTANFSDADGDIDLELVNQRFEVVDLSARSNVDSEQVSVDYVNGDQCYYARAYVLTAQDTLQTTYSMSLSVDDVDPALECSGAFEPNDAAQSASSLLAALEHPTQIERCPKEDIDYYYVLLSASQTISLRGIIDPPLQGGTLRLQMIEPGDALGPNEESAPGQPVAEIDDYTAPVDGRYYVAVSMFGSQRRARYRLEADNLGGVDLKASNLVVGPGSYAAGEELRFGLDVTNLGSDSAPAPTYEVFLGDSPAADPATDTSLGAFSLPDDLAGNTSTSVAGRVALPGSGLAGDTAYIHVIAGADLAEDTNPDNNVATTPISLSTN